MKDSDFFNLGVSEINLSSTQRWHSGNVSNLFVLALLRGRNGVLGLAAAATRSVVVLLAWHQLSLNSNVVVGKFSHLRIVDADDLCLFVATETEERNEVHDPQNDGLKEGQRNFTYGMLGKPTHGHDEGVGKTRYGKCQLNSKLSVVVIKPATRDHCDAVSARNAGLSEKTSQQVANYSTDSVRGKNLLLLIG